MGGLRFKRMDTSQWHNPEILIDQNWTYAKYSFFTFSNLTQVYYRVGNLEENALLYELPVKDLSIYNDTQHAVLTVTRGNDYLNYTLTTTVYRGARFANITSTITALSPNVSLETAEIRVVSNGNQVAYDDPHTICMIDNGVKALGQLIFDQVPYRNITVQGSPIELEYHFTDNSSGTFKMLAGAYSVSDNLAYYSTNEIRDAHFQSEIAQNLESPLRVVTGSDGKIPELSVFNYRLELQNREVSYVVCRDIGVEPKFREDPLFSLVFINKEVAIFKVNGYLSQG
jgi:hypothetical protein